MSTRIQKYLQRHADILERWPIAGGDAVRRDAIIVIPSLAEYPGIQSTLDDLAACSGNERTTVVVVVNHREDATDAVITNNRETVAHLAARTDPYSLVWIEAVLPAKDGVGLARKIGMDHALNLLHESGQPERPIVCLDADTRVDDRYLEGVLACFATPRWAVVFDYTHRVDPDASEPQRIAIAAYDLHLTYCEAGLHRVGTPYAYTAMGSAMACTAEAYAACGGMRRKQAGEDFYFLQALAKTGRVDRVPDVTVRPSARVSDRVPFGTGRAIQEYLDGKSFSLYHSDIYRHLRDWAQAMEQEPQDVAQALLANAEPALCTFLTDQGFVESWDRILAQGLTPGVLVKRFQEWFDAFRILKAIHHLRDHGYPNQPAKAAVSGFTGVELDEDTFMPTDGFYDHMRSCLRQRMYL